MPRDTILTEMANEARIRLESWKSERESLAKAAARIAELDEMIAGAEAELETLYGRKSDLRPEQPETPERGRN